MAAVTGDRMPLLNLLLVILLGVLATVLGKVENKLIISGHTDATPYRQQNGYNNWNLSGDRALRARNALVDAGMSAHSVLQVTAQADVMPLRPEDPQNGANRRVEILLLTASAETFDPDELARQVLGVAPHWSLNTAVARTMNWYRQQRGGADARALCLADIDAWEARP